MNTIINALRWRYATKKFDADKKLSDAQFAAILEALRLSPSSFGLQPWKFIVVRNAAVRKQLRTVAWNQSQVTDASHFVVIAVPTIIDDSLVDNYIALIKKEDQKQKVAIDEARLEKISATMKGFAKTKSVDALRAWVRNQAYIALGVALAAAATEKIDACPMEGFDAAALDKILGLHERGLSSVVCVAFGFRASDDAHAHDPKLRYAKEEVTIEID